MRRHSVWAVLGVALVVGAVAAVLLVLARTEQGTGTGVAGPAPAPVPTTSPPGSPTASPSRVAPTEPRVTLQPAPEPTRQPTEPGPGAPVADYVFPVGGCAGEYAATHHDYPAADIFTGPACSFVSPVDGRVDEIGSVDDWDPTVNEGSTRGGIFVSVVGVDGVRYYGSHLASVAPGIGPGDVVRAGQVLGTIGETGSARGTGIHLHFGISWPTEQGYWWIRRGVLAPQPYLDSWRAGGSLSPVDAVRSLHDGYGDDSTCRAYC